MRAEDAHRFVDRGDAGRQLGTAVGRLGLERPVVVALPRGGVPVGREVATALGAPLEILLVRKIGAPGQPEYALGAVVDGDPPQVLLNPDVARATAPSERYLASETQHQIEEIARRRARLLRGRQPLPLSGRTVVVVDDGAATGATMRVALGAVRRAGAARIVAALPVAPVDVITSLRETADDVVCLMSPSPFLAVGNHYRDFDQVSDDEVAAILARDAAGSPGLEPG